MRKIPKKVIKEAVEKLAEKNPYKREAVAYVVRGEEAYLWRHKTYSEQELREMYAETVEKDFYWGAMDRVAGYYDKWYRYNHADEGAAYDLGQRWAADNCKCADGFVIIPCLH